MENRKNEMHGKTLIKMHMNVYNFFKNQAFFMAIRLDKIRNPLPNPKEKRITSESNGLSESGNRQYY